MIPNFEDYTHDLTQYEQDILLPLFLEGFKSKMGATKAVTNKQIIASLKKQTDKAGNPYIINDARVRKIINHIRVNGLIDGLVATSKGYYVTGDPVELARYIDSLKARAGAISKVSGNMKAYLLRLLNSEAA